MKKTITIAIPCYNEEKNIVQIYKKIESIVKHQIKYNFEYMFVDNGSMDKTKKVIKQLIKKHNNVSGIFLSRNFGPEASGMACHEHSNGDAVIGIAADHQDPPELIPQFIKKWEEGYDVVMGSYIKNQDNFLMAYIRKMFYYIFKKIANIDVPINMTGFGLLDKKVIVALRSLPEKYRFARGLTAWVGFKRILVPYERKQRLEGKSSYGFFDYIKNAERGVFGFSYLILDLMVYGGIIIVFFSFLFIIVYLYTVIVIGNPIKASIPTILAIVFFGGIQLLAISIIGKYIQVIVEETKNRPMYIIDEISNIKN